MSCQKCNIADGKTHDDSGMLVHCLCVSCIQLLSYMLC